MANPNRPQNSETIKQILRLRVLVRCDVNVTVGLLPANALGGRWDLSQLDLCCVEPSMTTTKHRKTEDFLVLAEQWGQKEQNLLVPFHADLLVGLLLRWCGLSNQLLYIESFVLSIVLPSSPTCPRTGGSRPRSGGQTCAKLWVDTTWHDKFLLMDCTSYSSWQMET